MKTQAEYKEYVKSTNKIYNKSSADEKRVMIAQDVLKMLDMQMLKADCGTVNSMSSDNYSDINTEFDCSIQELMFSEPGFKCECCADGALIMGMIGRENKMNSFEFGGNNNFHDLEFTRLRKRFSQKQIAYIEWAFEGFLHKDYYVSGNEISFTQEEVRKVKDFYLDSEYHDTDVRLRKIMENIVQNKGKFIL